MRIIIATITSQEGICILGFASKFSIVNDISKAVKKISMLMCLRVVCLCLERVGEGWIQWNGSLTSA